MLHILEDGQITTAYGSVSINGTSLVGAIDVSYADLVAVFGEPDGPTDGDKVDAEWDLSTPYGPATIYNYKDGYNYNGPHGRSVVAIRDWHIGGHSPEVLLLVQLALKAHGCNEFDTTRVLTF